MDDRNRNKPEIPDKIHPDVQPHERAKHKEERSFTQNDEENKGRSRIGNDGIFFAY